MYSQYFKWWNTGATAAKCTKECATIFFQHTSKLPVNTFYSVYTFPQTILEYRKYKQTWINKRFFENLFLMLALNTKTL
jgi:hypothetical protein